MKLLCLFGFHRRSGRHAHTDEKGDIVSVCRRCRKPMIRRYDGRWELKRA